MEAILRSPIPSFLDPRVWGKALMRSVAGNMKSDIMLIVGGMVVFLIGLALAPSIITQAVTAGTTTGIGSFAGTQSVINLLPMIFSIGLTILGLGAMLGGGYGVYKQSRG